MPPAHSHQEPTQNHSQKWGWGHAVLSGRGNPRKRGGGVPSASGGALKTTREGRGICIGKALPYISRDFYSSAMPCTPTPPIIMIKPVLPRLCWVSGQEQR